MRAILLPLCVFLPATALAAELDIVSQRSFAKLENLHQLQDFSDQALHSKGEVLVRPVQHLEAKGLVRIQIVSAIPCGGEANCIDSGLYYMSSDVWNVYKNTFNVTTGALFVPFKYHFSDHAITPGGSLGLYAGLKWGNQANGNIAAVVAAGLSAVQQGQATANFTPTTSNGVSNAGDTLYGATFATGLIGRIGSSGPQFGILAGKDFIDKSKNYKYDGKWWLSVSIGYAFSN